ncbi:MAG TPA: CHASE3 domain-containing protein, partial [Gemmatimonadales bacterium]|nr:CHASE3 domain-containing protein [Gemmatimonadales bacterium]
MNEIPGAPRPMSLPVRTRLVLGFVLTLGLLAAVVLLAYRNTERLVNIGLGVPASQTIIAELEGLLTGVQAAETGLRGYLLTERDDYLVPFEKAKEDVAGHRARLAPLADDVPTIARIDTLADRKIRELDSVFAAYRSGGIPAARAAVLGGSGRTLLDSLRETVSTLSDERAEAGRAARRIAAQRSGEALRSIALLSLSALLLLGALAIALVRFLNERIGVEASLVAERGQLEERVRDRTVEVERERERATQEAARAREVAQEYRTLVEQVQDYAIFRLDREGRPQSWNEGVARVLGYGEDEFLG